MEELLQVLNFAGPQRIDSQDISSNYFIHKPLDNRPAETPYLQNEEISFISNANSNQYLDSRASYVFFRATAYQTTTRASVGTKAAFDTFVLNSCLPFSAIRETVNNNTVIYEMSDTFNRFSTARFFCSSKPLHNKRVRPFALTAIDNYAVFQDLDYTESEEYAGCGFVDRIKRTNGITLFRRDTQQSLTTGYVYFYIPLQCLSALAGANQLLPIGYLSQVSQIGHRIDLRVITNALGMTRLDASDATLQDQQVRIYEPQLIGRYITIHNPEMQKVLFERFKRVTPEAPLLIPYNSFTYDASYRFNIGEIELRARYNISKRSLKGMIIRFNDDSIKTSEQLDKNLNDTYLNYKTIQISFGGNSKMIPVQPYNSNDNTINHNIINSYLSQQYNIGRHIFDPNNTYSSTGCYNRFFPNSDIGGTQWARFIVIDMENFRMLPKGSEDITHSNGENTYVNGNSVEIYIQLHDALANHVQFETYFCYSALLMVSDNYIDNIENKTVI